MKKKDKSYQTVGERILNALNNVPVTHNIAFRRSLKARSEYIYRQSLKIGYDKDDSPAYLIDLAIFHLNMQFSEFKPNRLLDKNHGILSKIGLKKPEVMQKA